MNISAKFSLVSSRFSLATKMIKPVVIISDQAPRAELETDLHVWDETTFRQNADALGNDINAILVSSEGQKIDDLVAKAANLVAIVSTGPAVTAQTKAKVFNVASIAEAVSTIQKAVDGEI